MNASERCQRFIQGFESCRLRAYADPKTKGPPYTCGWGSTAGVTCDTEWTQDEADAQFRVDLGVAERLVQHFVQREMTQGQFDAFVSIFQNVGPGSSSRDGIGHLRDGSPSTLLRKFNAGDLQGTEREWLRWVSPGTSVTNGLTRRRLGELDMFREEDA